MMNSNPILYFAPEEIVFIEMQQGCVAARRGSDEGWSVNTMARQVLEMLAEPQTLEGLCSQLSQEFDVDPPECEATIAQHLAQLVSMGWLEPVDDLSTGFDMRNRYLRLIKYALVNMIYPEHELRMRQLARESSPAVGPAGERTLRDIRLLQPDDYAELIRCKRQGGVPNRQPTRDSHTMVGLRRLDNLEYCARRIFLENIPGDFMEAGVCQGGASIFMRALQEAFGQGRRRTWVADSFQGLPPPSMQQDAQMYFTEQRFPWLAISEETVRHHFKIYNLLSPQVQFLPGWFEHSLPASDTGPLALLRLDCDLYKSTHDVLAAVYERVSMGGYVIVDDYGAFEPCRRAVDEFRQQRGIVDALRPIDWSGVFWRKTL